MERPTSYCCYVFTYVWTFLFVLYLSQVYSTLPDQRNEILGGTASLTIRQPAFTISRKIKHHIFTLCYIDNVI